MIYKNRIWVNYINFYYYIFTGFNYIKFTIFVIILNYFFEFSPNTWPILFTFKVSGLIYYLVTNPMIYYYELINFKSIIITTIINFKVVWRAYRVKIHYYFIIFKDWIIIIIAYHNCISCSYFIN